MNDASENDLEARLVAARAALTGARTARGAQAWFRREMGERTGWEPAKSTVSGWISSGEMPEKAEAVLEELEAEAEKAEPQEAEEDWLEGLGDKKERNILLVADWIRRDPGTFRELGKKYGVSHTQAQKLVERAGVSQLPS